MNVNGARFHLLLGAGDWGRCEGAVGGVATALGPIWEGAAATGTLLEGLPAWDRRGRTVTLAPRLVTVPLTRGEPLYDASSRRGAVADRYGNVYFVAADRRSLFVEGAGCGEPASVFWPDPREGPAAGARGRIFADAPPSPGDPDSAPTRWLGPLAISADDHLLVVHGTEADRAAGLLRFDLLTGGSPDTLLFPDGFAPNVADVAPDPQGGLWLLDRGEGPRPAALIRLDGRLAPMASAAPVDGPALFQPLSGEPRTISRPAPPTGIPLPGLAAPTALLSLGDALILMGAPDTGPARLLCLDAGASAPRPLGPVPGPAFALAGRLVNTEEAELLLAARTGNQAWRVRLERVAGLWQSRPEADVVPLRRFGGRALLRRGDGIVYDSGPAPLWVPALPQRRRLYATEARFTTPVWDGAEPQCVWDRLRLDACIPPGTAVRIEARADDDPKALAAGETGWRLQPEPYLNQDGGELPGKGRAALAPTDRAAGRGCWDLLLQGVIGRHLQLRISLSGDARFTPRLRALRAWYPRVSWSRFLPAIYRTEPGPADFLERFLANMEGLSSGLEGRIATAQALLDPRTAPAESLDWLAGWLDTALDAAWDEDRRRLFIARATTFFAWRGTLRGLSLALRLAFDKTIAAEDFADDLSPPDRPGGIRILESHRLRRGGHRWPPTSGGEASGPVRIDLDSRWRPEEGSLGLLERWARASGTALTPARRVAGVDLGGEASEAGEAALWPRFAREQFGFVPAVGAAERARWQAYGASQGLTVADQPRGTVPAAIAATWAGFCALPSPLRAQWCQYLAARHRSIGRLNAAWGSEWEDFSAIPIPDHLPDRVAAIRDWLTFEGQCLPMAATAHRFTVLLPRSRMDHDPAADAADLALAARIVALEKPAHTLFDLRFYWAMNRVGEARLGRDIQLGPGSRAPALIPPVLLGRSWLGAGFVGGPPASPPATATTVRRQRLC